MRFKIFRWHKQSIVLSCTKTLVSLRVQLATGYFRPVTFPQEMSSIIHRPRDE